MHENVLSWSELSQAPERPGIYAWYFRPQLTEYDINKFIKEIELNDGDENFACRSKIVKKFLNDRIFKYFEQKPYEVELKGVLKPRYSGEAVHRSEDDVSPDLIERLCSNPRSLFLINVALELSTPLIASPLYIGKAENLRDRIKVHKRMIQTLKNNIADNLASYLEYHPSLDEKSFAQRVAEREIPSSQLFVAYTVVADTKIVTDLENILNRIYFPILGRN